MPPTHYVFIFCEPLIDCAILILATVPMLLVADWLMAESHEKQSTFLVYLTAMVLVLLSTPWTLLKQCRQMTYQNWPSLLKNSWQSDAGCGQLRGIAMGFPPLRIATVIAFLSFVLIPL